jgi:hypothetical protein
METCEIIPFASCSSSPSKILAQDKDENEKRRRYVIEREHQSNDRRE